MARFALGWWLLVAFISAGEGAELLTVRPLRIDGVVASGGDRYLGGRSRGDQAWLVIGRGDRASKEGQASLVRVSGERLVAEMLVDQLNIGLPPAGISMDVDGDHLWVLLGSDPAELCHIAITDGATKRWELPAVESGLMASAEAHQLSIHEFGDSLENRLRVMRGDAYCEVGGRIFNIAHGSEAVTKIVDLKSFERSESGEVLLPLKGAFLAFADGHPGWVSFVSKVTGGFGGVHYDLGIKVPLAEHWLEGAKPRGRGDSIIFASTMNSTVMPFGKPPKVESVFRWRDREFETLILGRPPRFYGVIDELTVGWSHDTLPTVSRPQQIRSAPWGVCLLQIGPEDVGGEASDMDLCVLWNHVQNPTVLPLRLEQAGGSRYQKDLPTDFFAGEFGVLVYQFGGGIWHLSKGDLLSGVQAQLDGNPERKGPFAKYPPDYSYPRDYEASVPVVNSMTVYARHQDDRRLTRVLLRNLAAGPLSYVAFGASLPLRLGGIVCVFMVLGAFIFFFKNPSLKVAPIPALALAVWIFLGASFSGRLLM